jgi:saccharopine dehydrogenase-like NADP-dependent oxidoreductase
MLALKAMSLLETVDTLVTGWGAGESRDFDKPGEGGTFGAALDHWLHQISGKIRLFRKARYVEAVPMEEVHIDYPGIGRGPVYTMGHPEPITLPSVRPELQSCCCVMDFPPFLIAILRYISRRINSGRMSVNQACEWFLSLEEKGASGLLFSGAGPGVAMAMLRQSVKKRKAFPELFAWASGDQGGKRTAVGAALAAAPTGGMEKASMGSVTGVPMAVALALLDQGAIDRHGVFAPESVIDPDLFFDALAPLCTPECSSGKDVLALSIEA